MSRSFRKVRIVGYATACSDKRFKVECHKQFRKLSNQKLRSGDYEGLPRHSRELRSPWDAPKDGKHYVTGYGWKGIPLDPNYLRKIMRK